MMRPLGPLLHRRHIIRTQKRSDGWRAQALRGKRMVGSPLEGTTETQAIEAVRAYLDSAAQAERTARGSDGYPTSAAVEAALAQITPTGQQRAMFEAHFSAPNRSMTATELARSAGYESYATANSQYGGLGRALAEEMEWEPELRERDGRPIWTLALATDGGRTDAGEWIWLLRQEVTEAAHRLFGWSMPSA